MCTEREDRCERTGLETWKLSMAPINAYRAKGYVQDLIQNTSLGSAYRLCSAPLPRTPAWSRRQSATINQCPIQTERGEPTNVNNRGLLEFYPLLTCVGCRCFFEQKKS